MLLPAQAHDRPVKSWLHVELEGVSARLMRELRSDLDCVNELIRHVEGYRGKMLRPMLVLTSGLATSRLMRSFQTTVGNAEPATNGDAARTAGRQSNSMPLFESAVRDEHRILATVMEMTHLATLVHDDVLDESEVRRGGRTVNSLRGNEAAVMLGDYLISHAYRLCSSMDRQWIAQMVADTTNVVCEGELLQLAHRENWSVDEPLYEEIIRRKTASLCGACCAMGAELSGADEQTTSAMRRYGVKLGMAFQIVDDLLDLTADESTIGKSVHRDLAKGKSTLPLVYALSGRQGDKVRKQLAAAVRSPDDPGSVQPLLESIQQAGAIEKARRRAGVLIQEAKAELAILPAGPGGDFLAYLADRVLVRER